MSEPTTPPRPHISRFSAGLQFHQMGELNRAEECYRETLTADPENSDALHLLGVLALQQGRHDESIQRISGALELKPETAEYHNNLASAYRELGRHEEAVEHYRQAIRLKPDYSVAYHNLGTSFVEQGKPAEAVECFRKALEISPSLSASQKSLDRIQKPGEIQRLDAPAPPCDEPDDPANGDDGDGPTPLQTMTVLHVGCGPPNPEALHQRFRGPQWREVRLDIDPATQPDVVASLTEMRPIEDNSVDAVWSSHNLEHLHRHDVPVALAEFYRVLKPGGFAFVTLPDLQQVAHFVVADKLEDVAYESPAGPITPLDCIFGLGSAVKENDYMAHKTGFTEKTLRRRLQEAGFVDLRTWTSPFSLWAEAYKADETA